MPELFPFMSKSPKFELEGVQVDVSDLEDGKGRIYDTNQGQRIVCKRKGVYEVYQVESKF